MALSLFHNSLWEDWPEFRSLERRTNTELQQWTPRCDVRETKNNFKITAEVPGAKKDDINIEVNGNQLKIEGKVHEEKKEEDDTLYRYERRYGSFTRSFTLPDEADMTKIQAEHQNGILNLCIPKKAKQESHRKKIEIK